MPGGSSVETKAKAPPPQGVMKHLEEAFAGTWHLQEREAEVGTGAGDTQLHGLQHAPLVAERQRTGWEGN